MRRNKGEKGKEMGFDCLRKYVEEGPIRVRQVSSVVDPSKTLFPPKINNLYGPLISPCIVGKLDFIVLKIIIFSQFHESSLSFQNHKYLKKE